jgi:hypothetical protein
LGFLILHYNIEHELLEAAANVQGGPVGVMTEEIKAPAELVVVAVVVVSRGASSVSIPVSTLEPGTGNDGRIALDGGWNPPGTIVMVEREEGANPGTGNDGRTALDGGWNPPGTVVMLEREEGVDDTKELLLPPPPITPLPPCCWPTVLLLDEDAPVVAPEDPELASFHAVQARAASTTATRTAPSAVWVLIPAAAAGGAPPLLPPLLLLGEDEDDAFLVFGALRAMIRYDDAITLFLGRCKTSYRV